MSDLALRDVSLGVFIVTLTLCGALVEFPSNIKHLFERHTWLRFLIVMGIAFLTVNRTNLKLSTSILAAFCIAGFFELIILAASGRQTRQRIPETH